MPDLTQSLLIVATVPFKDEVYDPHLMKKNIENFVAYIRMGLMIPPNSEEGCVWDKYQIFVEIWCADHAIHESIVLYPIESESCILAQPVILLYSEGCVINVVLGGWGVQQWSYVA